VNARRRIERIEDTRKTPYKTPAYVNLYFKRLENLRREKAGEPPVPLTAEEERCEQEIAPVFRAYAREIDRRREERNE
jgi:hypothetical protein